MTTLDTYLRSTGTKAREIARASGIGEPRLSRLRKGKAVPTLAEALAIEQATQKAVPVYSWASADEAAA